MRELGVLDGAACRHEHVLAALQLPHVERKARPVAREPNRVHRGQRIHQRHQVGRAERGRDETRQRFPPAQGALELIDAVLVPEDQENAHVVARRLGRRVIGRSNRQRQIVVRARAPRGFDELEGLNRLEDAIFFDVEVRGRQGGNRITVAIEDGHIDTDEVRSRAERRLALLRLLLLLRILCRRRGRVLTGANCRAPHEHSTHRHRRKDGQARHARSAHASDGTTAPTDRSFCSPSQILSRGQISIF